MDFPHDLVTNVFRIDGIKEIDWSFYTCHNGERSDDEWEQLYLAECTLRKRGKHVLLEDVNTGIWIFSLSNKEKEGVHQTLQSLGFDCLKTGMVQAGSLDGYSSNDGPANRQDHLSKMPRGPGEVNAHAVSANARPMQPMIQNVDNGGYQDRKITIAQLYERLIGAISQSLCHTLSNHKDLLQIGPRTCIEAWTLSDKMVEDLRPHWASVKTHTLSVDVKWIPAGILLITYSRSPLSRLCQVSSFLSYKGYLPRETPLLLSPSGMFAKFAGIEDVSRKDHSRKKITSLTSARLAESKISLPEDSLWIRVLVGEDTRHPFVTLWPAHLCFCEDAISDEEQGIPASPTPGDMTKDALAAAESWLLGKSGRMHALDILRKRHEMERQHDKSHDSDDLSEPELQLHQPVATQDMSRIYPTPPDVIPANTIDLSPNNNPPSAGLENGENTASTPGAMNRPYEQESEDLFGEMDIDMFASNGLTEADFSFFDEPNGDIQAVDLNVKDENMMPLSKDSVTLSTPEIQDDQEEAAENKGLIMEKLGPENLIQDTNFIEAATKVHDAIDNKRNDPDLDSEIIDDIQSSPRTSFDPVRFQNTFGSFDHKYALRGRYGFAIDPPMTSKPGERVSQEGFLPQLGIHHASRSSSENDMDLDQTDEDSSTESPHITDERQSQRQTSKNIAEDLSDMATPASHLSAHPKPDGVALPTLDLFSPRSTNQSRGFPVEGGSSPYVPVFVGSGHAFIEVAQMVVDQAVFGSPSRVTRATEKQEPTYYIDIAIATLSSSCGKANKRCTIRDYVSLGEKEVGNTLQNQKMSRPSYLTRPASLGADMSIFKLQPPYTCVRRTGTSIDISPASLRFWEELSLAPAHDSKNVTAFCIFPNCDNAKAGVTTFLSMIKGAYQSCNLGLHDLAADLPEYVNGQVPLLDELDATCELLGTRLGKLGLRCGNTVIYMVDAADPDRALPNLCAAFLKLFDAYNTALTESLDEPNDLVLQVLPSEMLFSGDAIPMPSPTDYRRLAFEVYDRCGPSQPGATQFLSVPAIRLARPIPKVLDLRLSPEASTPRLQSDSCMHIAYVWSPEDHWLTASWTDNYGILSWNACYCFGDATWQSFSNIVKEIWDTTCDMMNDSLWRVFICKDSWVDQRELDAWQRLWDKQMPVTFLVIDTDPLLNFPLQEHRSRLSEFSSGLLATPGNTPQSNAASPDISGFGTTPGGAAQVSTSPPSTALADHDAEARLVDVTDETWSVIISNTLQSFPPAKSTSSVLCPTLASAYLLRKVGPRDEDGVVRIAINIIYSQTGHRATLKEAAAMFAGLALLARVREMRDGEALTPINGILPWHIISARKAHVAVSATMRYGNG